VKAHLIRVFGFANFDSDTIHEELVGIREYKSQQDKPMVEVIYRARHRLVIRDQWGNQLATYTEGAVGSASGPDYTLADLHDNALKTAASDALKRCAINLGTQFGLSLYDDGNTQDVVKGLYVGEQPEDTGPTDEQKAALEASLGAKQVVDPDAPVTEEGQQAS
jgi:recombination DNA repair RAD52 pathway protein